MTAWAELAWLGMLALPPDEPEVVVRSFYSTPVGRGAGGLPDANERTTLAAFLDATLLRRLDAAKRKEAACERTTPAGSKPPLWEGGIFSLSTEGATAVVSSHQVVSGERASVVIVLEYVDGKFPEGHKYHRTQWAVEARLVSIGGRWAIDDIIAGDGHSLADELDDYILLACGT